MPGAQFILFGRVSVEIEGRVSRLPPGTAVVLARLVLAGGHLVTVAELSRALRPGAAGGPLHREQRVAVQKRISELRTLLDPAHPGESCELLRTDRGSTTAYRLTAEREQVDLFRFEDLVNRALTSPSDQAWPLLRQALALWRDRPLLDVEDQPFAAEAIARISGLRKEADRLLALSHQEPGQPTRAPSEHTAPSPATPSIQREKPDVPVDALVPRQLPAPVHDFVGREAEITALTALAARAADDGEMAASCAVDGTAGIGKTAFAVHVAHRTADRFPDGQLYIDLQGFEPGGAALSSTQALCSLLAAFRIPPQQIPHEVHGQAGLYHSVFAGRRILVLLDNARDSEQVRPLLPGAPGCLAIVTSRNQLTGLIAQGARPVTLRALTAAESRQLLAARVGPDRVAAEPHAAQDIIARCARLPLALAIAAARAATHLGFPLAGLAAELDDARSRLDVLTGADPATDLRAVFSWSYQRLPADQARAFRLLGLNPGPDISVQAAASLLGDTVAHARRLLTALSAAHLVEEPAPGRHRFHDLLRLYADELVEAAEDREASRRATQRLADHYRAFAADAAQLLYPHRLHLPSPDAPRPGAPLGRFTDDAAALSWLDTERANLVALIVQLARDGHHRDAWGLADLINGYFKLTSNNPDWRTVAGAGHRAAMAAGEPAAQAITAMHIGMAEVQRCRFDEAAAYYTRSAALARQADWTQCHAVALNNLAACLWNAGRVDQTIEQLTQALELHRRSGRVAGEAVTLANLAVARMEQARDAGGQQRDTRLAEAIGLLTEALELHRKIGDHRNEADTLRLLAEAHREAGDQLLALHLAEEALSYVCDDQDFQFQAAVHNTAATIHARLSHPQAALDHHRQALDLARRTDDHRLQAQVLLDQAATHARLDQPHRALAELDDVIALARRIGSRLLERQAQRILSLFFN